MIIIHENILLEFEISCCEMEALRLCGKKSMVLYNINCVSWCLRWFWLRWVWHLIKWT